MGDGWRREIHPFTHSPFNSLLRSLLHSLATPLPRLTIIARHYIELSYGSQMATTRDKRVLLTLMSMFISSASIKPDYDLTTVR